LEVRHANKQTLNYNVHVRVERVHCMQTRDEPFVNVMMSNMKYMSR